MGTGLVVEVVDREKNVVVLKEVFHDFPITIGRDPIVSIDLDGYPFVTKFHAKLDLWANGAVMLRDQGSTNGTAVDTPLNAIAPREWVDLRGHAMAFMIGVLHFSVSRVDAPRTPETRDRGGAMLSSSAGKGAPTARNEGASVLAMSGEAREIAEECRASYQSYRGAWARFYERFAARLQGMPPATRMQVLRLLAAEFPAIVGEPDFQRLAEHFGVALSELRADAEQREEDAALQLVHELAAWYGVATPVGTDGLIAFARKLQDAVDVLCVAYIRLRDGLRAFQHKFETEGARREDSSGRLALEVARTPREIGALLVDWTDPSDRTRFVKNLIADLAVHEMGLVNGVVQGGAALVNKFSPATVLAEFSAAKAAGRVPFSWVAYKRLWSFFERYHDDFAREEKGWWGVLFGDEFLRAYQQVSETMVADEDLKPSSRRRPISRNGAPRMPSVSPKREKTAGVAALAPAPKTIEETPENHGMPPKGRDQGPTGTVVVPRVPAPKPNTGPMNPSGEGRS
jgi:hypothetical protein